MPISQHYDKEQSILFIILEGNIVLSELETLYREIISSSDFPPDIRSVWNLRNVAFETIDSLFIKKIFSVRKNFPERGNARAAFIAEDDLSYGVSRMYEAMSSFELPQYIQVFRDFPTAVAWILNET